MIDRTTQLSVSRQSILLRISRGSIYYRHRLVSDADLKLMLRTDKLHMDLSDCDRGCAGGGPAFSTRDGPQLFHPACGGCQP